MGQAAARRRARREAGTLHHHLAVAPDKADRALVAEARAAAEAGDIEGALGRYGQLVREGHTSPDVHNDLGALLAMQGALPAAVVQLELALALAPDHADARRNLLKALEMMALESFNGRRWADAVAGYLRLVALDPSSAIFHNNAGAALRELQDLTRALPHLLAAQALSPSSAIVHYNLGSALLALERREAEAALVRAIELDPGCVDAYVNLALVYDRLGALSRAAAAVRKALALAPDHGEAHGNLASLLREQGETEAALDHFRRARALRPGVANIHSSYLLCLQGDPGVEPAALLAEHRDWERRFAAPIDPGRWSERPADAGAGAPAAAAGDDGATGADPHPETDRDADDLPRSGRIAGPRSFDPERRLRIGYLSPDLRRHAVASFIEPIIAAHDRAAFDVICYSDATPDVVTDRIRREAGGWCDVRGASDEAVAAKIAADGIDIAIDLAGHTAGNRLLALARRPAPVQVTYCGYPGTTGLGAIGWRLTDAVADPEGAADAHHAERLWRLPHGFLCFQPDPGAPRAEAPPATGMTFGSFNNLAKIGPAVVDRWAQILRAVPGSRLLLKSRALSDDEPRARLRAAFVAGGVTDAERICFASYSNDGNDHLALYRQVDVALDSFPYNGATTTCEALWMGVPVITLAGRTHAGRVGASLLTRVGLDDLVAATPDAYVELAVRLAADAGRRFALRGDLRRRMAASPLTSPATITRDIERAYREMWRQLCASNPR